MTGLHLGTTSERPLHRGAGEGGLFHHVMACLDRVPHAARVIGEAASLAAASGATLTALRVLPAGGSSGSFADPVDWELARREHLAEIMDLAETTGAAEGVHAVVASGSVVRCVHEEARREGVDLLVLGAGGEGRAQAPTLGGTARHLAETFPGSVLIVPERVAADRTTTRRVIVPMDGSRAAEAALRYGAEIARDRAAELVVLHAVPRIAADGDSWAEADDGTLLSRVQARADRAATQRLERLHRLLPVQNRAGRIVRLGGDDPRRALLRAIGEENGELVVLSARGLGTDPDLPIGSTAEYLLSRLVTPTLLVRTAEAGPHPATIMAPRGPRAKAGRDR